MWRRATAGLVGIGLGLLAAFVLGVGALEAYAALTTLLDPTRRYSPSIRLLFTLLKFALGGGGLYVASRLLRRAALGGGRPATAAPRDS